MTMVQMHEKHWSTFMEDELHRSLYGTWWTPGTVNHWRHTRLLEPVLEVMKGLRKLSWLTVGDGAGMDAWRLLQSGFDDVTASDLDDTVLRQTFEKGHINKYRVENAESLTGADNSVDFILCKEALHHMSRPYAAIYEMLRVARYGCVLIEPQDPWIDWPCRTDASEPHYESVGNFVYQFSRRDLEKIGFGTNITGVATKNLIDIYIPGCEHARCIDGDPIWMKTQQEVEEKTQAMKNGSIKANYVMGILMKNKFTPELFQLLQTENPEWKFLRTDKNPYLDRSSAT